MPILYFSDNIVLNYLLTVVRVAPVVFVTLCYHHLTWLAQVTNGILTVRLTHLNESNKRSSGVDKACDQGYIEA